MGVAYKDNRYPHTNTCSTPHTLSPRIRLPSLPNSQNDPINKRHPGEPVVAFIVSGCNRGCNSRNTNVGSSLATVGDTHSTRHSAYSVSIEVDRRSRTTSDDVGVRILGSKPTACTSTAYTVCMTFSHLLIALIVALLTLDNYYIW